MNKLYYGDCLTIMNSMPSQCVDLIYLDPPFNSNRSYNAIYKTETGLPLPDQIDAFCDMWTLDCERDEAIRTMPVLMRKAGIEDKTVEFWRLWMNALRSTQPRLLAYLSYMMQRLVVMKGLLRPAGSIYLHCDPTASHYIKVMMDGIFGHENFRNEIIWHYTGRRMKSANRFNSKHDIILFYAKSNHSKIIEYPTEPYTRDQYVKMKKQQVHISENGKEWIWGHAGKGKSKHYKIYIDDVIAEGKAIDDVWNIPILNTSSKERLGYPTQKPLALLDRIIKASTNEGDVVLDPFCGCATTIEAAHKLNRQWIGIDIAIHAVKRVAKVRLQDRCKLVEGTDFEVNGVPHTLEGAQDLWKHDKYHFQKWAVEEVNGFVTTKRTADGGIDGRLYFSVPDKRDLKSMVLEVKGGKNVSIADLRALHSVLEREDALMAGLIIMEPLGAVKKRNFEKLMAEAGTLEVYGGAKSYPKMQILSVPEILQGKRFNTPTVMGKTSHLQEEMPLVRP